MQSKTQSLNNFEVALEDVVRSFPKDTVSIRAKEILAFVKIRKAQDAASDTLQTSQKLNEVIDSTAFSYAPETPHLFLIVVQRDKGIDLNDTKNKMTSFNNANFKANNLSIINGNIDLSWLYISVSGFNNKEDAMNYYNSITSDPVMLELLSSVDSQYFVISPTNLIQMAQTKAIQKYAAFFQDKYLQ